MARSDFETLRTLASNHSKRPLLTHLNADTSWLISFPHPNEVVGGSSRKFYHLLVDPWLEGTNIVGFTWVMSFKHAIAPSFASIQEVRQLIIDIETAAGRSMSADNGEPDCVCVTHFAHDHCSEHTLMQIHPDTPIISTVPGIARIKSFKHFNESMFSVIPDMNFESPEDIWRNSSLTASYNPKIPSWLKVGQLPSDGPYPSLHWATIIAWSPSHSTLGQSNSIAETFLYSPHGIRPERLCNTSWATDSTKGRLICSMHGFAPAWSPYLVNLGVQNGYTIGKMLKPTYWIPTHDEELSYTGLIGWMQSKVQKTLQDIVRSDESTTAEEELRIAGTTVRELQNGETFCLV